MEKVRKRFWTCLGCIVLAALAIELVVRPFFPGLVRGESALTEVIRLLLSVMAGIGGV